MKKENKTIRRVIAWMLTVVMVLSMIPITAFAEENPVSTGCTHIHDESCGYVEAVAEVLCDKECTDTDEDGVIYHTEDCVYKSEIDGQECNHIHDENCGGLSEEEKDESDENENNNEITEEATEDNEPELSEKLKKLQESINALPTGEEYRKMTENEKEDICEKASAISEEYFALSEEEQEKIDITRLEALFKVINEGVETYNNDTNDTVTFLNSGYPYGKDMGISEITLVVEVEGSGTSYQWQVADGKGGTFSDIEGANESTYSFTPTSGKWYRCVANDSASEAVMTVKPNADGRSWTNPYSSWYISNGTMAYMANGHIFDAVGLYTKNNTQYMLATSYNSTICWEMFSNTLAEPNIGNITYASLDALRVSFDASDDFNIYFEADLADGQQAFAFGCDTKLGNGDTSGSYSDSAALNAMVKDGVLQQIAMIGSATVDNAADTDPAFVIAPVYPASKFWIGHYNSRQTYAYNISGGMKTETIDNQNVVTLVEGIDSGMTMSWMNITSGGSVKFRFSVGDVAHTGAVSGKVDYVNEKLTGLDPNEVYTISFDSEKYTITADPEGKIHLIGKDNDSKTYDFTGKTIMVAKKDSGDTPAQIEVSSRPETPHNPSDLEENENDNSNPSLDANIEIVELTLDAVTISPKEGQQYAYSMDNTNWTTLTELDSNGNYVISGLQEVSTVYVRTRISATASAPASEWSGGKVVTLKPTVKVLVRDYNDTYDGENHSINIEVTNPAEGATITYSSTEDGYYSETNPTFKKVGEYTVYYRVTAEGYYPTYRKKTVTINKSSLIIKPKANQFKLYSLDDPALLYDVEGLKKDDTITDALEGALDRVAGTDIGFYNYTLGTLEADNYEISLITGDNVPQFEIIIYLYNWGKDNRDKNRLEQYKAGMKNRCCGKQNICDKM